MKTRRGGFTLIELMITVAVIGILAAVAYPSYQSYLVKSNRRAAQAFMMDVSNKQKQFLIDSRSYAATVAALGMSAPPEVDNHYVVTIGTAASPPAFTVTATPKASSPQANDGTLTLSDTGAKGPAGKW